MSKQVSRRRGSSSQHQNFTGSAGEITIDTTNWRPVFHDGTTAGGHTGVKRSDIFGNDGFPNMVDPDGTERFYSDSTSTNIQTSSMNISVSNSLGCELNNPGHFQTNYGSRVLWAVSGNVMAGHPTRLSTSTRGFLYIPQVTGVPTANPDTIDGFCPISINTGNMRLYVHNQTGKWWFANLTST